MLGSQSKSSALGISDPMCEHPQPSHSPASPLKGSKVTESLLYYYLNTVGCINAIFL